MKILITSGTGTVAQEIIRLLIQREHTPVIMTHSIEKIKNFSNGTESVYADFAIPDTWNNIFNGIDKICLITPPMLDEGKHAAAFAKTAHETGVDHIVFLGIHNVLNAPHIPHFAAKILVKNYLQNSGKPYTIIEPNNFFQNDSWFLPVAKSQGVYLQPIGEIGLSRVDVRDIAQAMVNGLLNQEHLNKSYPLVGPEVLTGSKTSNILSQVLNKEIIYPQNIMNEWKKFIGTYIPTWLLEDWKTMYEFFNAKGLRAEPTDYIKQEKILGRPPRKYEDYIKEQL